MAVPTILHLYNDILATVRATIEVINDAFVMHIVRMVFLVKGNKDPLYDVRPQATHSAG